MITYQTFSNPPITEALLDIRTELSSEMTLNHLATFHEYVKKRFPEKKERKTFTADIKKLFTNKTPSPEEISTALPIPKVDGYMFVSPSESKIVQSRLDGFTFNKLKPYENWNIFQAEAKELWEIYCKIAKPTKISRIALRYVNRLDIPLNIKDFKEYILTVPEISPTLPQALAHFYMKLVLPNAEIDAVANISETIEVPNFEKGTFPLIYDIDVYKNVNYNFVETDKWWDEFEKLRNFKNQIFFDSITDKTKELFK